MRFQVPFSQTLKQWVRSISNMVSEAPTAGKRTIDYAQKAKNRAMRKALKQERRRLRRMGRNRDGSRIS